MDTKTLAPKRSVIYLSPYVRNSINETPYFYKNTSNDTNGDTDHRNDSRLVHSRKCKSPTDSDKTSSTQPDDSPESNENGVKRGPGNSRRINREISNSWKKKVNKHIGGQFDQSKRLFVSALWAYLEIKDSAKVDSDKFNCFRLLFGPENTKHKLFNNCSKNLKSPNNLNNKKILNNNTNGNGNYIEEMEEITSDSKSSSTSSSDNEMESPILQNKSEDKPLVDSDKASKTPNFDYLLDKSYPLSFEFKLLKKCISFFESHGLVAKVRKLPPESFTDDSTTSRRTSRIPMITTTYPSYHFITRQRRHMIEQIMRSKSFLETEFNLHSDPRNSRSPFSLFEPHPKTLSYLQDVVSDLNDHDFTGISVPYLSLNIFVSLNIYPKTYLFLNLLFKHLTNFSQPQQYLMYV